MFARIKSATLHGIDALPVNVEVDLSKGLPGWQIVGLPETMIKESKERVAAAIRNSGFELASRKTTINLAPADIKKHGTAFDLAIAVGLLAAAGLYAPEKTRGWLVAGELSLTGSLAIVPGVISYAIAARDNGLKGIIVPVANVEEANLVRGLEIIGVSDLVEVVKFLKDDERPRNPYTQNRQRSIAYQIDFADIKGQHKARRALEIAAAGYHHVLMFGPPGTGKTMLAERLPTILPPLDYEEALETTRIHSIFGLLNRENPLITTPPFRAPHHSASYPGLIGGGSGLPTPGEISLAHNGVLFLDEIAEFRKDVLEVLRQPLESGLVNITRARAFVSYPARFMLVAAMNPCRCGYLGHPTKPCICSIHQIQTYRRRLSGPLLDRIDLHVEVGPLDANSLTAIPSGESSATILSRVMAARKRQANRYHKQRFTNNGSLGAKAIREFCKLDKACTTILAKTIEQMHLSARAYDRIIRVARTIADIAGSDIILPDHIFEASQYRGIDKEVFG